MGLSAISSALSGMGAARDRLDVASHNIANAQTEGFKRQIVTQRELPQGGVTTTIEQAQSVVQRLPTDMVEQMKAGYTFDVNARTLRTQQDMIGTLVNLRA